MGNLNLMVPAAVRADPADSATAAANTAVAITYGADANNRHVVADIVVSYEGGAPTAGALTITDGGTTIFQLGGIVTQGPLVIPLSRPKRGTKNQAMVVTLAAGGASVVGKVNLAHWLEPDFPA